MFTPYGIAFAPAHKAVPYSVNTAASYSHSIRFAFSFVCRTIGFPLFDFNLV